MVEKTVLEDLPELNYSNSHKYFQIIIINNFLTELIKTGVRKNFQYFSVKKAQKYCCPSIQINNKSFEQLGRMTNYAI